MSVTKPVIVRIPPNGREIHQNQWMVKQILDTGVAGLMFPHIETAEQAINAVKAVRYPQPAGAPNVEPEGVRGASNAIAARYWGMSGREYELPVGRLGPPARRRHAHPPDHREQARRRERPRHCPHAEDGHIKVMLWAGGGDMSLSYGHDEKLTQAGLDAVIGRAGVRAPRRHQRDQGFQERYEQGVRCSSNSGRRYAAAGPSITPEERKAVGR